MKVISVLENKKKMETVDTPSESERTITGIPTGFIDLDDKISGFQPSDLILVAARPGMGKTAFAINIAQHVAFEQNKTVAIFSLGMPKEQLVNRLTSLEKGVDARIPYNCNQKVTDGNQFVETADSEMLGKANLIIDDTAGISVSEICSKCRKYKSEYDLEMIIIDYLQLLGGKSESEEACQQELSEIFYSLKELAKELNVPVVVLSQLDRGVEQRADHRPMLSDFSEWGLIEQDVDVCMFIDREDYYHKDTEHINEAEIIIAKQKNGLTDTVVLTWLPQYVRFENLQ